MPQRKFCRDRMNFVSAAGKAKSTARQSPIVNLPRAAHISSRSRTAVELGKSDDIMKKQTRWIIGAVAVTGILSLSVPPGAPFVTAGYAQYAQYGPYVRVVPPPRAARGKKGAGPPAAAPAPQPELPPRVPFSAADAAAAVIPGIADARFWADSATDFTAALPSRPGPWLVLSSGGEDGAFGIPGIVATASSAAVKGVRGGNCCWADGAGD